MSKRARLSTRAQAVQLPPSPTPKMELSTGEIQLALSALSTERLVLRLLEGYVKGVDTEQRELEIMYLINKLRASLQQVNAETKL